MVQKKTIPSLCKRIREILESISRSTKSQARIVKRATIFIMSSDGKSDPEIANAVNLHVNIIGKWRRRFAEAYGMLAGIEKDDPDKLEESINGLLLDNPRPGAPEDYDANQRALVVTMACQNPNDYGFEISHWSLPCLRIAIEDAGFAPGISESTINRILNDVDVCPHKHQYWLHSKPNGITKADREARKSDDFLKRDFTSDAPFTKAITDITEIKCRDAKLYVSAIFDCYDLSVLGLAMDTNMKAPLCVETLKNAIRPFQGLKVP